jgi:hypothetical protein
VPNVDYYSGPSSVLDAAFSDDNVPETRWHKLIVANPNSRLVGLVEKIRLRREVPTSSFLTLGSGMNSLC